MDISLRTNVRAPIAVVWREFNEPASIVQWDATADWYTTKCVNDVRVGGRLEQVIDLRAGGSSFHFCATYTAVEPMRLLAWETVDGQNVRVQFAENGHGEVELSQIFSVDPTLTITEQRDEWQAVLDSFAHHVARTT